MLAALTFARLKTYGFVRQVAFWSFSLALLSGSLCLFSCNAHADQYPSGVFSLTQAGRPVNNGILAHPLVKGASIRLQWQNIEREDGVYDWSYFDTQTARVESAGKKILLRIVAGGNNTPKFVIDKATKKFSFIDNDPYSITYKKMVTIAVFWDPILLQKLKNFIIAMGQRFSGHHSIVLVSASCANAISDDWNVPHTNVDVQNWRAVGYTSDKLINACKEIIDTTMAAFPSETVLMAVGQNGNKLDPGPDYVASQVIEYANTMYPGRFMVQKNSLSTNTPDPAVMPVLGPWQIIYDNQPAVGGQMLWFVTNDTTCRMNGKVTPCDPAMVLLEAVTVGARYGMRYQEIYQQDILNPALADVIRSAADLLTP